MFEMRFALISTVAALALAMPLVSVAAGPRMDEDQFVTAVRCAAYSGLPQLDGASSAVRVQQFRLNGEARAQEAEVAARAHAEVREIVAHAMDETREQLIWERNAVCGRAGALIANSTLAPDAG
jgi:hypothetical protein